ncbi:hypothetical protein L218DRAFT_405373 [Marasmius fiardii PR-910]|nr:hypothetical protein L218DRAFT_405373 [Marasmius fiardii PR-910]
MGLETLLLSFPLFSPTIRSFLPLQRCRHNDVLFGLTRKHANMMNETSFSETGSTHRLHLVGPNPDTSNAKAPCQQGHAFFCPPSSSPHPSSLLALPDVGSGVVRRSISL